MRTHFSRNSKARFIMPLAALLLAGAGCDPVAGPDAPNHPSTPGAQTTPSTASAPPSVTIKDTTDLPAIYTPQKCADLIKSFPGWDRVKPVPEHDAQGLPTLFYAAIPITARQQLDDLKAVGIHTDSLPIFMDEATEAQLDGKVGSVSPSTCGGAQMVWALVPGPIFNLIAKDTIAFGETLVEAIILLPVPDAVADTSITYEGLHSVSYEALRKAGFVYLDEPAPAPADSGRGVETKQGALSLGDVTGLGKKLVKAGADLYHDVKDGIQEGLATADRWVEGSVKLSVRLDVRNVDTAFGPTARVVAGGGDDGTTPMTQAWGAGAGQQIQLPGVKVSAMQHLFGISTKSTGTTDANSTASMDIVKGKSTSICLSVENAAGSIHDLINEKEICNFRFASTGATGMAFQSNSSVSLRLQDKYFNMLAQFTDGRNYLMQVAGYTPRQVTVLTGWPANLLPLDGHAVTPCLGFPNIAVDGLNGLLSGAGALLAGPLGWLFAGAVEQVYEVDMWMPDGGSFATNRTLEDRTVSSHEYGHFAMCSLLYSEDRTKMVQIPSLLIQRILEGKYVNVGDETTRIMEAWADFFAGQTANGYNYFDFPGEMPAVSAVKYCPGGKTCWEGNYVEDPDASPNPSTPVLATGVPNQMRRVATILFDAFDGHRRNTNQPGFGDFWRQDGGLLVPAGMFTTPADDDPIALPGSALKTLVHDWTHNASPLGWRVSEQQFFSALNTTIRATPRDPANPSAKLGWCDACALFAPHDGQSCNTVSADPVGGVCKDRMSGATVETKMTAGQMAAICEQDPIRGFVGPRPAATDPTSACTFAGCAARTILVGTPGDSKAACVACSSRQVSVGGSCVECGANELVGGADGNACVACPLHQIPDAAKLACKRCDWRQVAVGGVCQPCPAGTWAAPDETCQACPAGQLPYQNRCVPLSYCTCDANHCATLDKTGLNCIDIVG